MNARAVAVLGCTSGAGKSWIATALCRWYARRGLRVAPFKAQNMSNHARVVAAPGGRVGEIGSAQYFQARAAGVTPDVRMNPVLLKPEAETRSQVVLMGEVDAALADLPWRERSERLWPVARDALASLRAEHELIVVEGAGSPAEINLAAHDYVNTLTVVESDAAALLVADIDRGGAFAHLYGTHALMDTRVRARLRGHVLNRFRGDAALLAPGPALLERLTGVPTIAVVPMLPDHGLPEEDAVPADGRAAGGPRIVVLATPHASNLDEFEPLRAAGLSVRHARDAGAVHEADWLVLPGSKHTRADLAWLRRQGLDDAVLRYAASGRPLLAVCGGLQWLGERIDDPAGVEGGVAGSDAGLGLLALQTGFGAAKRLARAQRRFDVLEGPWAPLSGLAVDGYEIHAGQSVGAAAGQRPVLHGDAGPIGWQRGNLLGLYLHGVFENPAVVQALFGVAPPSFDAVFDRLADHVDRCFAPGMLMALLDATAR